MKIVCCEPKTKDSMEVGELQYGAVCTVSDQKTSVYIKVKKRHCGRGVSVNYTRNNCVLLNLKHGTLREIPGDTVVRVMDAELRVNYTEFAKAYRKF